MKVLGRSAETGRVMGKLREECKFTPSQVAQKTEEIAEREEDPRFHVSRQYLRDIELGNCVPSSYKLEALALVYNHDLQELLAFYEVTRENEGKLFTSWLSSNGSKVVIDAEEAGQVIFTVAGRFRGEGTVLLTDGQNRELMPARWNEMLGGKARFAVIGTQDNTMGKLLPPDCLVVVDTGQKTLDEGPWETEEERPIYLAWRNKGNPHVCCWAYHVRNMLTLLPYQANSGQPAKSYKTPAEAEIIGHVIHAWHLPRDASQAAASPDRKLKGQMNPDD